jgi:HD superfamily phosphohydrolase
VRSLRWDDRVYGPSAIDDRLVLDLIGGASFQRLRGIRQAGPSALVYSHKTVTRFEHSLGVYVLLRRLGADRREQVAGLLHDISHTAFSHAVDFVYASIEQDHHEQLKPQILHRPDVAGPLAAMGYRPEAFYDDSVYPLLEQPLPRLCADRLDYFLRDSLAVGVSTPESVARVLESLVVVDGLIALKSADVARDTVERFAVMNRDYYASRAEAFIYNEFGDALREGLRLGVLDDDVLLTDDATVLDRLRTSGSSLILEKLARLEQFGDADLDDFEPRIVPKQRWLDPPVLVDGGTWRPLSGL